MTGEAAEAPTPTAPADEWNQLIGCLLIVCCNLLLSGAFSLQKSVHVRAGLGKCAHPYAKSPAWRLGLVLMVLGETGSFVAYGFAPIILLAPVAAISIVASSVLGAVFMKECVRPFDAAGPVVVVVGVYLIGAFTPSTALELSAAVMVQRLVGWQCLLYVSVEMVAFSLLLYFYRHRGVQSVLMVLALAALLGSVAVISMQGVAGMLVLSVAGSMQLTYPIFYVLLVTMMSSAFFQADFLWQATEQFGSTRVIPINYIFSTISSVAAGGIFYQQFHGAALLNVLLYILGCLLCALGVLLVTRNRGKTPSPFLTTDFTGATAGLAAATPDPFAFSYRTLVKEEREREQQTTAATSSLPPPESVLPPPAGAYSSTRH